MNIKNVVFFVSITSSILLVSTTTQSSIFLELSSPAFKDKRQQPVKYTCEGEGISPPLTWLGVPVGTQSLLVIMDHQPNAKPANELPLCEEVINTLTSVNN